jgi:hypothetical protein
MGAVTYPEPTVVTTVQRDFVPIQINVMQDSAKPLLERFRQIWTPDIRILEPNGFEYVHWNGYLPPMQYVSRLLVGEGETYLRMHGFDRASSLFEEVVRVFPMSEFALEA